LRLPFEPIQELLRYDAQEGIETRHEVTPYLCRTDARGPHLSAGVVTALFDEVGARASALDQIRGRPSDRPKKPTHPPCLSTLGPGPAQQVSTAACILQDKTHRPGVSVALDVEMLADVGQSPSLAGSALMNNHTHVHHLNTPSPL